MVLDWLIVIVFLFFLIGYFGFTLISLISHFTGAPFVPTGGKDVAEILKNAHLKKGQVFIELGCGEGRVVRSAVRDYHVRGVGIDINPFLILFAQLLALFQRLKTITLKTGNLYATDLSKADVLYLFLLPKTLEKLKDKLQKETPPHCLIISQGFRIKGWDRYINKTLERKWFSTYYYKLH